MFGKLGLNAVGKMGDPPPWMNPGLSAKEAPEVYDAYRWTGHRLCEDGGEPGCWRSLGNSAAECKSSLVRRWNELPAVREWKRQKSLGVLAYG